MKCNFYLRTRKEAHGRQKSERTNSFTSREALQCQLSTNKTKNARRSLSPARPDRFDVRHSRSPPPSIAHFEASGHSRFLRILLSLARADNLGRLPTSPASAVFRHSPSGGCQSLTTGAAEAWTNCRTYADGKSKSLRIKWAKEIPSLDELAKSFLDAVQPCRRRIWKPY